jgi:hypothetical protein
LTIKESKWKKRKDKDFIVEEVKEEENTNEGKLGNLQGKFDDIFEFDYNLNQNNLNPQLNKKKHRPYPTIIARKTIEREEKEFEENEESKLDPIIKTYSKDELNSIVQNEINKNESFVLIKLKQKRKFNKDISPRFEQLRLKDDFENFQTKKINYHFFSALNTKIRNFSFFLQSQKNEKRDFFLFHKEKKLDPSHSVSSLLKSNESSCLEIEYF